MLAVKIVANIIEALTVTGVLLRVRERPSFAEAAALR